MKHILPYLTFFSFLFINSQNIKSPSEFLGYELGTEFTRHHEVVDYFEYLAATEKDRVVLSSYGMTNERRPLLMAVVSSADNIKNLESLRLEHLNSLKGKGEASKAIVWLSYNVHGNESVGTESALKTIHSLLTSKSSYLENTIVIMDPCINPDGRDRYSNWYNQFKNTPHNVDPNSKEHREGWWTGRSNHYMFDLNRDWAWLTQKESKQRIKVYNKWMPHVHVDFHEQGVNNPYFFAPAAEPYHEVITSFQRDFQETIGRNHAKYFDANGWFYFTKEVFDLFYPSYGDTYPTYNGAIGMTYEQGGSGRAGLGIITQIGDTLTLKDRIAHHYTTGLSTVEVASKNAERLNSEFREFFTNKNFKYKSYALKGDKDKIHALTKLLEQHELEFGYANKSTIKGFNYTTGVSGTMNTDENTLIISTNQPKGTMVKVLFEPNAKLSDSLTYDITAWSLPYAYGLEGIASTSNLSSENSSIAENSLTKISEGDYAFVTDWTDLNDARFLAELLKEKVRVRTAHKPFELEGKAFQRGSLIITKGDNEHLKNYNSILEKAVVKYSKALTPVSTGFVDSGKDFGSRYVKMIKKPKIAVFSGKPTSTLRFGEIWHFFEQQLNYPMTVLDSEYFNRVDLNNYDILILPDGRYGSHFDKKGLELIKNWVAKGGNLIAMGGAIKAIDGEDGFGIKEKTIKKESSDDTIEPHENSQRERMKQAITGAIFKVKVDNTHPLAYGYGNTYFTLKLGSDSYDYLKTGTAAYLSENSAPVAGFAGSEAQKKIKNTLVFGVEPHGRGQVSYFVDNPLFRGFWENGKLFFANALFMVD
ncbi:M14 family zinc carboxypeptidase [Croceivirga thetidis]|uniref:Zinc carboxypeptidase n=1 Tax=Croceivirga thetidis TaxID=2721623 RepID=A0ABX1GUA0_9FLAO|nr:M14 family zinc carboxypeptidase [Croceivirga thetidis]NKI33530.1 zinc carboxypeptidase [Croceivirga thetidis]